MHMHLVGGKSAWYFIKMVWWSKLLACCICFTSTTKKIPSNFIMSIALLEKCSWEFSCGLDNRSFWRNLATMESKKCFTRVDFLLFIVWTIFISSFFKLKSMVQKLAWPMVTINERRDNWNEQISDVKRSKDETLIKLQPLIWCAKSRVKINLVQEGLTAILRIHFRFRVVLEERQRKKEGR